MAKPLDLPALEAILNGPDPESYHVRIGVLALTDLVRQLAEALGGVFCRYCHCRYEDVVIRPGGCELCADARAVLAKVKL